MSRPSAAEVAEDAIDTVEGIAIELARVCATARAAHREYEISGAKLRQSERHVASLPKEKRRELEISLAHEIAARVALGEKAEHIAARKDELTLQLETAKLRANLAIVLAG